MPDVWMIASLAVGVVLVVMILRWLRDRARRRAGTFSRDNSADNPTPGATFWTGNSDSDGGSDGGGAD